MSQAPPPTGGLRSAPLAPTDLEECLALDRQCLRGLWTPQQWHTELGDPGRPGIGLWAGDGLVGVGCAWLVIDELHITLVAVLPDRRRQGLGRRVLGELLREGRRRGAARATLEVGVENRAAIALYRGAGFTTAGRRRGYYRNGEDALIQWLRLGDGDRQPDGCG
ncbi:MULTISPECIES: GNAT family N-acetyltransferase [Aphanothece]|uniref:GNAT family N-acetyltransferase n=1 Tax=Aphanothece TaxID=1121 RepID=UPI003984EDE9